MINNYVKEKLDTNGVTNVDDFLNVIREECQKIILYSLGKTDFFKNIAFYGGTCLRIFHNIDRYSEDLDFNVTHKNVIIDMNKYINQCIVFLESFGFSPSIKTKKEYDSGEIARRYISIPVSDISQEYFGKPVVNREQTISIKIEISKEYSPGAIYENKLLSSPMFANVLCFDYPSLFAGKIHALLVRNWKNREKGRDFYDYMFYLSQNVKFNFDYLKNKLSYSYSKDMSNLTIDELKQLLKDRFDKADYNQIKKDIETFVINKYSIDGIQRDLFISSVDLLKNE